MNSDSLKKNLAVAAAVGALFFYPAIVAAQTSTAGQSGTISTIKNEKAPNQAERTKANAEITRRLTSLNSLLSKIGALKKLPADQKTQLSSAVQGYISDLTNLKAKIDAGTDLSTLRTDVKTIVSDYRVYALFLPKINELAAIDRAFSLADKLMAYTEALQNRLQRVQQSAKDTQALQTQLTDVQSKIADAKSQLQAAQNELLPLAPGGYPENKITLKDARTKIMSAVKDLRLAWGETKKIRAEISRSEQTPSSSSPFATTNR